MYLEILRSPLACNLAEHNLTSEVLHPSLSTNWFHAIISIKIDMSSIKQAISVFERLRNVDGLTGVGTGARRQDLAEAAVFGEVLFEGDKLS